VTEPSTIALFAMAAVAVLLVPGPAVVLIVTRTVEHGRPAALVVLAGVHLGTSVHVLAAAAGLSAALAASPSALDALRYAGAAYLIAMGLFAVLRAPPDEARDAEGARRLASPPRLLVEGMIVNVLNPKMVVFFIAFMPEFVDRSRGPVSVQVLVLGAIFIVLGLVTYGAYALVAAKIGDRLRARGGVANGLRYVSGCMFVGLGVIAALSGAGLLHSIG
jgi:threonine/homoserine/homoserine lactone efflux protein